MGSFGAIFAFAMVGLLTAGGLGPTPTAPPCGSWEIVPSPNASPERNILRDVSASGPTAAWAVGEFDAAIGENILPRTLTLRWDGAAWAVVPSPNVGPNWNVLEGVMTFSTDDALAVGWHQQEAPPIGVPQTLVLRWDGTEWRLVESPVVRGGSEFLAVDAAGGVLWAVGDQAGPGDGSTGVQFLTARSRGGTWEVVPAPIIGTARNHLYDVLALAEDDVWAVGRYRNVGETSRTLALHWDGSAWSTVPTPNVGLESALERVDGTAPDDIWATGSAIGTGGSDALTLHWDGSSWTAVASPGGFGSIAAIARDDVWALGMNVSHWDGARWNVVGAGPQNAALGDTAVAGACDAWAVGLSFDASDVYTTHIERLTPPGNPFGAGPSLGTGLPPTKNLATGAPPLVALPLGPNARHSESRSDDSFLAVAGQLGPQERIGS